MLNRYKKFLKLLDKRLEEYFNSQKPYIHCKKGCTSCCETGEYPFSRLETEYLMQGFLSLPADIKNQVRCAITDIRHARNLNKEERFNYRCPFLVDKECVLYDYRGITCRTHGLAYLDANSIKLPYCANSGLNYAKVFDPITNEVTLKDPIKENLRIDRLLRNKSAEEFQLECGEIRPLIDWFEG